MSYQSEEPRLEVQRGDRERVLAGGRARVLARGKPIEGERMGLRVEEEPRTKEVKERREASGGVEVAA